MLNKIAVKDSSKIISSAITLSVVIIMILPLCGFLFECGCTWLWAEMDENCNIHDLEKVHKCPWCQSMMSALVSIGLSTIFAVWFVYRFKYFDTNNQILSYISITLTSTLGLFVFFVIALFTAWVTAFSQNYPYFLI